MTTPYGHLKLALIRRGLHIPPVLQEISEVSRGYCSGEPGDEIVLALAEDFIAKVSLKAEGQGALKLVHSPKGIHLDMDGKETEVGIIPLPNFIKIQMQKRTPVSENICLDGYCLNIFLRAVGRKDRLNLPGETILSVIESAFKEGAADLVQINMDYNKEPDRGWERLMPLVQSIKKKFSTFVALRGFPPENHRILDELYAAGTDLLCLPMAGFAGSTQSQQIIPIEEVQQSLEYATGIFQPGTVWTELVLEPNAPDMLEKIDMLTGKRIIPLLKLQAPSLTTRGEYEKVANVVQHLKDSATREKLPLKWLYPACRL